MTRDVDVSNQSRISSAAEQGIAENMKTPSSNFRVQTGTRTHSSISPAQRADNAAQAIHNSNMEGMEVSQPVVQETYDYIAGKISATTLVARVKALHGLE